MKFGFSPTYFLFGATYLPGIAFIIHFGCFMVKFISAEVANG